MDLLNMIDLESAQHMLGEAAKADITGWTIKIALVWWIMEKKVLVKFQAFRDTMAAAISQAVTDVRKDFTDHFAKVETALKAVVDEMAGMKKAVSSDLSAHSDKLKNLTDRVDNLEKQTGVDT